MLIMWSLGSAVGTPKTGGSNKAFDFEAPTTPRTPKRTTFEEKLSVTPRTPRSPKTPSAAEEPKTPSIADEPKEGTPAVQGTYNL